MHPRHAEEEKLQSAREGGPEMALRMRCQCPIQKKKKARTERKSNDTQGTNRKKMTGVVDITTSYGNGQQKYFHTVCFWQKSIFLQHAVSLWQFAGRGGGKENKRPVQLEGEKKERKEK